LCGAGWRDYGPPAALGLGTCGVRVAVARHMGGMGGAQEFLGSRGDAHGEW
jgi:hypothetical protein